MLAGITKIFTFLITVKQDIQYLNIEREKLQKIWMTCMTLTLLCSKKFSLDYTQSTVPAYEAVLLEAGLPSLCLMTEVEKAQQHSELMLPLCFKNKFPVTLTVQLHNHEPAQRRLITCTLYHRENPR